MIWHAVTIETLSSDDGLPLELITALLLSCGVTGIETEDAYETRLFLENSREQWDYADETLLNAAPGLSFVRFYVDAETGGDTLTAVRDGLKALADSEFGPRLGSLNMEVSDADDSEWAENWKRYYKPFRVGRRLVVRPLWEHFDGAADDTVLSLNPGQVFGTGLHQTTRMCLETLENIAFPGARVLDAGCGSGILSVAAVLLSCGRVVAADFDKQAARVVNENACANNIPAGTIRVITGDIVNDAAIQAQAGGPFDIILANIVADAVISLTPAASKLLAPGGRFVSSGIIKERLPDVLDSLKSHGFNIVNVLTRDEWIAVEAAL